jgi:hypothetical protein
VQVTEKRFRGSVICRVLGYPISYGIVQLLLEKGKLDLAQISVYVRRSRQATCAQLTKLRLANIVRYEKKGVHTLYWIKYQTEVKRLLDDCETLVKRMWSRLDKDT